MARVNLIHNITDDSAMGGQKIDGSLVFNDDHQTFFHRDMVGGNRKTWTISHWIKFHDVDSTSSQRFWSAGDSGSGDVLKLEYYSGSSTRKLGFIDNNHASSGIRFTTLQHFRDNVWYHLVFAVDTTQATASNRVKIYVNGERITEFEDNSTHNHPPNQNYDTAMNKNDLGLAFGRAYPFGGSATYADMQLSQLYLIDGQQLEPTSFGYTESQSGIWRPKKYTGTFGTNGFYYPLDGSHHITKDLSGNGNDSIPYNLRGTVPLRMATGGLPILNTNKGGTVARPGVRPDPFASNIVLALPLSNRSNAIGFDVHHLIKGSGSAKTLTNNGSIGSNVSYFNFYGRSGNINLENASSQNIGISASDDFNMGTGDFTVECWIYPKDTNASDGSLFVTHNGSTYFAFNYSPGTGRFNIYLNGGSAAWSPAAEEGMIEYTKWNHVALVKQSNVVKLFVNGRAIGSYTHSGQVGFNASDTTICRIGGGGSSSLNVYMQDMRVYKGVAKYTDTFTCASVDSAVIPDSPSGVAVTRKFKPAIGSSSGMSSDGRPMTLASSSDLYLDGDFTIEFYIYLNSIATNEGINPSPITFPNNSGRGQVYINASNKFYSLWWPSTDIVKTPNNSAQIGKWQHVAVTRSSNSCRIFLDGELQQTATSSQAFGNSYGGFIIGGYDLQSNMRGRVDGHLSNLRIIKGTALYTSSFTVPTEPLTNVTNTKLLCYQSKTNVEALTVDPNTTGLNNKNWTRSGTFSWSIGADSNVNNRARLFDGNIESGSPGAPNGNPGNVRFTFDSPITGITKCRLRTNTHNDAYQYRRVYYNGANGTNSIQTGSNTTAWHDVTSNVGNTLNWVEWGSYGGADGDRGPYGLNGIEINDVLLTDKFRDNEGTGSKVSADDFSPFDDDTISPAGGYPILNRLRGRKAGTVAEGNFFLNGGNYTLQFASVIFGPGNITSGKYIWEIDNSGGNGTTVMYAGVSSEFNQGAGEIYSQANKNVLSSHLHKIFNQTSTTANRTNQGQGVSTFLLDVDNRILRGYYDTRLIFTDTTIPDATTTEYAPFIFSTNDGYSGSHWVDAHFNFGQRPFIFTPPEGYESLSSANLEPSSITNPKRHFDCLIYSGNSGSSNIVTGLQFQPDLVWIKTYSGSSSPGSQNHYIVDSVRGATGSVTKKLYSNATGAENSGQNDSDNGVKLLSNGIELTSANDGTNSNNNYVAWCWKAGGAAVTNSNGSVTSQVSANQEAGFSIVTYTGSNDSTVTFGHGLDSAPEIVLIKRRDSSNGWRVYHHSVGLGKYLSLSNANAENASAQDFASVSATTFGVKGGYGPVSINGGTYVAYCWHSVPGYSKVGSYNGNGSTNGKFVYTGFRPAFVLLKRSTDSTNYWEIRDNKRDPNNPANSRLFPNRTDSQSVGEGIDFLNNGFKLRNSGSGSNTDDKTYIYMAFAEQPSPNQYGAQPNAR